ncbi:MAG: membrane protein insertase YidC [Betaproteobacteria bacterium]|nr:MAG: membrane protein insertase YidC [Betaproteobacteria bacterium]
MDNARVIAAIVFAGSIILLADAWMKANQPPPQEVAPATTQGPPAVVDSTVPEVTLEADSTSATPVVSAPSPAAPSARVVTVRTDLYQAKISTQGGVLQTLELLKHYSKDDPDTNLKLFDKNGERTYVAQSGLIGQGLPNHSTLYQITGDRFELQPRANELLVELRASEVSGLDVIQRYTFRRGSYVIDVDYEITNKRGEPLSAHGYFQFLRDGNPAAGDSKMMPTFTGGAVYTDESKFTKVDFEDMDKNKVKYPRKAEDGWAAIVQHYFVAAWLPPQGTPREYFSKARGNNLYAVGTILPVDRIAPGAVGTLGSRLYAGPQDQGAMAAAAPGLELTVDYGWLTVIAAPLFWLLSAIQQWVGNWGVAIILLTVIIKLVFYPLSAASYKSMAKMRVLAPKLQSLKETYGDDRQRMQQAMMELYKTEKINPLGGCLPILVQIPVFIALYWVLMASVELRNAPFILWIDDLSAKDPYYVLPILMGLSMIIQSWLSPTPPDPVQAKIMKIMPVVFSVFFFFFPAGLVLYWLVNNILSILQQWRITRVIERSKPANANR